MEDNEEMERLVERLNRVDIASSLLVAKLPDRGRSPPTSSAESSSLLITSRSCRTRLQPSSSI